MLLRVRIRKYERGLLFRNGDFVRVLMPGTHYASGLASLWQTQIETVNMLDTWFRHPLLDVLLANESMQAAVQIVDLNDSQRALVWKDDRLAHIVGPGRHAFWREPFTLNIETFDVGELRLRHDRIETIRQHREAPAWLKTMHVGAGEQALFFRNDELIDTLDQGRHVFWKGAGDLVCKAVDRREQVADVAGQDIMTNDKVTLRVNMVVTYQVTDAVKAVTTVDDHAQALYREAQLALRAAVGTRTLDALLADKEAIGGEVRDALAARAAEFGVVVRSVGLRDIMLPGDMKAILNQVIAAEKQAQANLITRREETAAARSQANTARLLAENPALARIKELELVQEMLVGAKTTFVFGNTDIVDKVRRLGADASADRA